MSAPASKWSSGDRTIVIFSFAVLCVMLVLGAWTQRGAALPSQSFCVSVVVFGQECPGCGLTRSFVAMGSGNFAAARAFNPLGPVLLAGVILLLLTRIAKLFLPEFQRWHRVDLALAGIMVLAMIARTIQFYFG
ncbi:MAG TPA: DUF2752 domain-containing protein [Thermoanaerobaculia bacterium]|nr:DUF2752 domain-containing protein [Thermoanaerobaculia bacterium]